MKKRKGVIPIIVVAIVAAGLPALAADPVVVTPPTPSLLKNKPVLSVPETPAPGMQFTIYLPVNLTKLHPSVKQFLIGCAITCSKPGAKPLYPDMAMGPMDFSTGRGYKRYDIASGSGSYQGTVTFAFNVPPGIETELYGCDKGWTYNCNLSGLATENEVKEIELFSPYSAPSWNTVADFKRFTGGKFP